MGFNCSDNIAKKGGHVIIAGRSLERSQKAAEMIQVKQERPCHHAFRAEHGATTLFFPLRVGDQQWDTRYSAQVFGSCPGQWSKGQGRGHALRPDIL
jgi:hypothetical protein